MKLIAKAIVSVAALAAFAAHAEGPYVGGSVGNTRYSGPEYGGIRDRSDTGGKLYGGYGFTPNVAIEAGWAGLGVASTNAGSGVRTEGLFVDAVGKVPLGQNFSALGRIGAFHGKSRIAGVEETSTQPKVGLGLQYDFTKQLGLRGEWERYRFKGVGGGKGDSDMYSLGVNFQF